MSYEIITVATHKEGKFDELINNKYEKITVLGMGEKWRGYTMKNELIYDYIKNMDDNKIIIFLDGFDTIIQNDPKKAIEIFKKGNHKILISKDPNSKITIFPRCKDNLVANVGMYMGYVKYLKKILELSLTKKCKDDQVILNKICKDFEFIDIDKKNEIFYNVNNIFPDEHNKDAIFISYPGTFNIKRTYRMFVDYTQFILIPIFIIALLIIVLLFKFKYNIAAYIVIIIAIIWLFNMDYSCIT